LESRRLNSFRC